MKLSVFIGIISVSILLNSCLKDKALKPPPSPDCSYTVSYYDEIVPIINSSCISGQTSVLACHDTWITEYPNIPPQIASGKWEEVCFELKSMPPFPSATSWGIDSLTADEIQIMKCWIEQGYEEN